MSEYPRADESDVVLVDGSTVRLRPVKPTDAGRVMELHRHLSLKSLRLRYFAASPLDDKKAAYLTDVDYESRYALVAETNDRVVALAGYDRLADDPDCAEVAFTVEDAFQGRGVGTKLLERLAATARHHGIRHLEANVLPENRRMIDVLVSSGFAEKHRFEEGVVKFVLDVAETAESGARAARRGRRAASASIKLFFEPRTVAVVGASRQRGRIGSEILENLVGGRTEESNGFTGRVVAIHPTATEIGGTPAYPAVSAVPGIVDLVIVAVPAEGVLDVVDDALSAGVKALVVITAGFGETGPEGRALEATLLAKVRATGARLIGPNCMGILSTDPEVRLNATFSPVRPPVGRVAMSTQSGALGVAILEYSRRLGIGLSTFVSVGNKADVSGNDLIQYWAEDPRTDVILLYLESFGNPRTFARLAREVSREKPIVAVKGGRSLAGARAASSHTGALSSSDRVVDALFRHAGVIRTTTLEELFGVAMLLANQPVPRGRRLAILTNAGGPGILASDACEAAGIEVTPLSRETRETLRSFLPAAASVANPVDMLASASPEHYRRAAEVLLRDPDVDSVMVIFIPPLAGSTEAVARSLVDAASSAGDKTVLATFLSAAGAPPELGGIPCFPFPEAAAVALGRAIGYGEWRRKPAGVVASFPDMDTAVIREVAEAALENLDESGGWLEPDAVDRLLRAAGIPTPPSRMARSSREVADAARQIGYPVVLKAVGPKILHKSEVGGVVLSLGSATAAKRAYRDLQRRLGSALSGVLVQKMAAPGAETIVGVVQDPAFGPVIAYGTGGVLVELLGDLAFRLQPLTDVDAGEMLEEVRGTRLLRGFRGGKRLDERALATLLQRVSALVDLVPHLQEMDLNPVRVLEHGVLVLDARVRIARVQEASPSRRIAY